MTEPATADPIRELNNQAVRAMSAGDFATAREMLKKALVSASENTALWLNLAGCCRALLEPQAALAAVEGALRSDPRSFRALLVKGSLLEERGDTRRAAMLYGAAAGLAPPNEPLDPPTAQALQRARAIHIKYIEDIAQFISDDLRPLRERGSSVEAKRINAFIDLSLGRKLKFHQEPMEFYYPGMPAIEFWEREEFPWLAEFERSTGAIREELLNILRDDFRDFVPYIAYPDGLPIDQWKTLNHSRRWGALHLIEYGQRVEANAARCPRTMATLANLPQPKVPRRSPAAMFSALQPRTHIPPHAGVANTRLVVHLPLIVPAGCGFRVGNETRSWREGEAWVFDDTIEHEAWNDSDSPRVIMICDIWNPRLSQAECELVAGVMQAMDKFNGFVKEASL